MRAGAALALSGCVTTIEANALERARTYVGVVRVAPLPSRGGAEAFRMTTIGAGADSGLFLGWRDSRIVALPAGDCRLVLVINTEVSVGGVTRILEALKGQQPCIVDFDGRSFSR